MDTLHQARSEHEVERSEITVDRSRVAKRGELCRTKSVGDDCGKAIERQAKEKVEGQYQVRHVSCRAIKVFIQNYVALLKHTAP